MKWFLLALTLLFPVKAHAVRSATNHRTNLTGNGMAVIPSTVTSSIINVNQGLYLNNGSSITFKPGVSLSSSSVSINCNPILVGTLVTGSTFYTSPVIGSTMTLFNMSFNPEVASTGGSGDSFTCNEANGNGYSCSLTSASGATTPTQSSCAPAVKFGYGATIFCHIDSQAATRPIGNFCFQTVQN